MGARACVCVYVCVCRRLAEEIETLKERLQKYSEVHALDARSNKEKDMLVKVHMYNISLRLYIHFREIVHHIHTYR